MCLNSCLLAAGLPLAPKADPERQRNEAKVQPEGLFADVEEIIAELAVWGGKEK